MVRKPRRWLKFASDASDAVGDWGPPLSSRLRAVVLFFILAVWLTVIIFYLIRNELPDAKLLGIPIAAAIALGRRPGKDDDDEDDESED